MSNFTNEPAYKAYKTDILERKIELLNEIIRLTRQSLKNGWGDAVLEQKDIELAQMEIVKVTQRLNSISTQKAA